jgi:PDDEXK-like domain of unknown function (DUF3799)
VSQLKIITAAEYHADEAVGNSMLSSLKDSPAHCYALHMAPGRPERAETDALRLGTLTHTAVLEPAQYKARYTVKPEGLNLSTKEGKAWKGAMGSLEIITQDEAQMVESQRAAILGNAELASLFASGRPEMSAFWIDSATGLRCKCRPDWLHFTGPNRVRVVDLKTTNDITLDSVSKSIGNFGYHRQQAHYTRGLEACGLVVEDFVFAFVTKAYPFFALPYRIEDASLAQGYEEVSELLSLFSNCKRANEWPLSGAGVQSVGLPRWALRETELEISYVY